MVVGGEPMAAGVSDDHIIEMAFDLYENIEYRDGRRYN